MYGYTVLTVLPLTPASLGDTNDDYVIDISDYHNLSDRLGSASDDDSCDFNGDGVVNLKDFAILRGHFGKGAPASAPDAESANTPEPATLTFLTLGGLAILRRRPKR